MSEAWWSVSNARTEGFYMGFTSVGNPLADRMNLIASKREGLKQGERSMNGTNQQIDGNVQEDSIMHKASRAWFKWSRDNDITPINTQHETLKLMEEAFIDGYLNGFTKRFTEGA